MLEARIHQLQSDVVLDVQHAKVNFFKAQSSGRWVLPGKDRKSIPQEKTDIPKSAQIVAKGASKSQPSRWMEKLSEERKNKLKKQLHLQQKLQKNVKEKPAAKSKGDKSGLLLPGTAHKTVSTIAKKTVPSNKKSRSQMTLPSEFHAGFLSPFTSTVATAAAGAAAMPKNVSKGKKKISKNQLPGEEAVNDAQCRVKELAEVEELERRLSQQVNLWTSSSDPERLKEDSEGTVCGDINLSIRSYLEACVFAGDIERAHRFLLSQHRVMSRRKHLSTDVYNIMMRVWAKKVSSKLVIKSSRCCFGCDFIDEKKKL